MAEKVELKQILLGVLSFPLPTIIPVMAHTYQASVAGMKL